MNGEWIGTDLDGTLAHFDRWRGEDHIGEPIPVMLERVKGWLAAGEDVRIVTARVGCCKHVNTDGVFDGEAFAAKQEHLIQEWCRKHLGRTLRVTASKDFQMRELWDDRVVKVEYNTGRILA